MRSRFAESFNHDDQAARYDASVRNEQDPIRAGYAALLDWMVERAEITRDCHVVDLGSGTGNLASRIGECASLTCVDISANMTAVAREKLAPEKPAPSVSFVQADLLEYLTTSPPRYDVVLSSYAIHHLTEVEKVELLSCIGRQLPRGGRAMFGDLMFEDEGAETAAIGDYRARGLGSVADDIEEEFFWRLDTAQAVLRAAGLDVTTQRFSELSWGLAAR